MISSKTGNLRCRGLRPPTTPPVEGYCKGRGRRGNLGFPALVDTFAHCFNTHLLVHNGGQIIR